LEFRHDIGARATTCKARVPACSAVQRRTKVIPPVSLAGGRDQRLLNRGLARGGGDPLAETGYLREVPFAQIVQSIFEEESNDGTHETKSALLRCRRVGPEPGPGVSGSEGRMFQIEWRENGRRLSRSLKHRGWARAKRQIHCEPNHGKKPRKFNQDCTICHSCHLKGSGFAEPR